VKHNGRSDQLFLERMMKVMCIYTNYKDENWLQFLFAAKAANLKPNLLIQF